MTPILREAEVREAEVREAKARQTEACKVPKGPKGPRGAKGAEGAGGAEGVKGLEGCAGGWIPRSGGTYHFVAGICRECVSKLLDQLHHGSILNLCISYLSGICSCGLPGVVRIPINCLYVRSRHYGAWYSDLSIKLNNSERRKIIKLLED